MSGLGRDSYEKSYRSTEGLFSCDAGIRESASKARSARVKSARSVMGTKKVEKRDIRKVIDKRFVDFGIKSPENGVKRVWVVLVDNSGSNKVVAKKLRDSSGYLNGALAQIDPDSQIAFIYFSDHCDEAEGGLMQEINFVSPGQKGDKVLCSTSDCVKPAYGGDAPEAIECVLWRACDIDFNEATERHLILVSDVVAHGMGLEPDDGCPEQRDWKESVERVSETYTSFCVVGTSAVSNIGALQKKFVAQEREGYDYIDLSSIPQENLRLGMTANAVLFLIARTVGKENLQRFLSFLYEKWISEPIFGLQSEKRAKDMITRLSKFLEYSDEEVENMLKVILLEE